MAAPNPIQVQKYLSGIDYPASKDDIVATAKQGERSGRRPGGAGEHPRRRLRRADRGDEGRLRRGLSRAGPGAHAGCLAGALGSPRAERQFTSPGAVRCRSAREVVEARQRAREPRGTEPLPGSYPVSAGRGSRSCRGAPTARSPDGLDGVPRRAPGVATRRRRYEARADPERDRDRRDEVERGAGRARHEVQQGVRHRDTGSSAPQNAGTAIAATAVRIRAARSWTGRRAAPTR